MWIFTLAIIALLLSGNFDTRLALTDTAVAIPPIVVLPRTGPGTGVGVLGVGCVSVSVAT
jgi:hypothetical protein